MILTDLLASDAYTPVNKSIAIELGFVTAGYFGELIRQRKRFFDINGQTEFYFSQSQMTAEIGISEHEQRTALKILVNAGFVSVEKKGMPSKYHFKINDIAVLQNFEDKCLKNGTTSASKNEPHNKKENNKENNKGIVIEQKELIVHEERTELELLLQDFKRSRAKLRKPMTDKAMELLLRKLSNYSESEQIAMLEEAIEKGWQTVYPPKKTTTQSQERKQFIANYNFT